MKIGKKIRSQSGASITFALLIFLVCSVVSGIAIVAATASAGRMSEMAEMDQRYYAVVSAVGLLKDHFDGKKVTVTRTVPAGGTGTYQSEIHSAQYADGDYSILKEASETLVKMMDGGAKPSMPTFNLTTDAAEDGTSLKEAIQCSIAQDITASGMLVFDVERDNYKLRMIFSPTMDVDVKNTEEINEVTGETEEWTITTTTLEWNFYSLTKTRPEETAAA